METDAQVDREVERNVKEIYPRPSFEEYVGIFERLEVENSHLVVFLSCASGNCLKLIFTADSPEANLLRNRLNERLVGRKLGILKTDDPQWPILVRTIKSRNG